MKSIFVMLLVLIYVSLQGQDLKNTEWVKVRAERKDGSRIIDHSGNEKGTIKYSFKEKNVFISTSNQAPTSLEYIIDNDTLSIGKYVRFRIDSINTEFLIITEIPYKQLPDDRINRFTFISNNSIFKYLSEIKQIEITGDTLIEYNSQFAPIYKDNLDSLLKSKFPTKPINTTLSGTFVISEKNIIENIAIEINNNFSKKEIDKIIEIINSTSGSWILPPTPKPFQFKMNFDIKFISFGPVYGVIFMFHAKNVEQSNSSGLTLQEISTSANYFENGIELFQKGKFEKASNQFKKCIEIDSIFLDAYYDLAYCYQKLGNLNMACETWERLKEMGQKQGEYLHDENCK